MESKWRLNVWTLGATTVFVPAQLIGNSKFPLVAQLLAFPGVYLTNQNSSTPVLADCHATLFGGTILEGGPAFRLPLLAPHFPYGYAVEPD